MIGGAGVTGDPSATAGDGTATDGTVTITRTGPDLPGGGVLDDRCDTSSRQTVARYDTAALGTVVLQCGNSGQGYEHIRVRHTQDWTDVVSGHGSRDWDDAMLTAVQTVLDAADRVPAGRRRRKVCYGRSRAVRRRVAAPAEPFVKVIVSSTTDRVITAYPTRDDGC